MSTPSRTMVVWCIDWPLTAAGIAPHLSGAVVENNVVVACSAAARNDGVRRGLRLREAQQRSPSIEIIEYDEDRDARVFEPVVRAIETFTPLVHIVRPGLCAVETRGPSRYFKGDRNLKKLVASAVEAISPCKVGIADGLFAATLAAKQNRIIADGQTPMFLETQPVKTLDKPDFCDLLQRLGIKTLGQLASLPVAEVTARFGPEGELAHRLANGKDEYIAFAPVEEALETVAEIDPPVENLETAAFIARNLANELQEKLATRALACTQIGIEAETEFGEHLIRYWKHDGFLTANAIAQRARWQLDGWLNSAHAPTGPITLLRLIPQQLIPDVGQQLSIWGGSSQAADKAARGFARIQAMLEPDSVLVAQLSGGQSPIDRVILKPWGEASTGEQPKVATKPKKKREKSTEVQPKAWPGQIPAPSPALVYKQPRAVEVKDKDGDLIKLNSNVLLSASPATITIDTKPKSIVAFAGPWPVVEHWWDAARFRKRARFQIVTKDNSAYLVMVERNHFYIEAKYD